MSEYTAKRARTRGHLLAAGQELLPGAVRLGLEHSLGPGRVTRRADVSRQTWYRYWRADDSAYLEELLQAALDTVTFLLRPHLAVLGAGTTDGITAARALTAAHFSLVTQRRVAMTHLTGVVLAVEDRFLEAEDGIRPSSTPEIVCAFQARVREALTEAYGALLRHWGRRPRPGTDLGHVVDVVAALADGFALRHVVDRAGSPGEAFAPAAVALLEGLTVADPAGPRIRATA